MNATIRKLQKPACVFLAALWSLGSVGCLVKAIQEGGVGNWLWFAFAAFLAFCFIAGLRKKPWLTE